MPIHKLFIQPSLPSDWFSPQTPQLATLVLRFRMHFVSCTLNTFHHCQLPNIIFIINQGYGLENIFHLLGSNDSVPTMQTYPPDTKPTTEDNPPLEACGRNQPLILSNSSGRIVSPNYPGEYPSNQDCSWLVQVEEGYVVKLRVDHFELEPDSDCE